MGEVLNENYYGIKQVIHDYVVKQQVLPSINVIGHCGESPAHIAIYKNDEEMLKILIAGGADPNFKNSVGETLTHSASKFGRLHLLKHLYETGNCNLEIKDDKFHYTPLEYLENIPFGEDIFVSLRLYKNWRPTDPDEKDPIMNGRLQCIEYLKEKLEYDRNMKIVYLTRDTTEWKLMREKTRRILTGDESLYNFHYHGPFIEYPEKEGECQCDEYEQRFFNQYRKGIHSLAVKTFTQQYFVNSMKIGEEHAIQKIVASEKLQKEAK